MAFTGYMQVVDNMFTNAQFQQWGSAISKGIAATGWVKADVSGQVDWATATAQTNVTTYYEVWQSSDTFSTIFPIYMQIFYGYTSSQEVQITLYVGSVATDLLSTTPINLVNPNSAGSANGQALPTSISGTAGRLTMLLFNTWAGSGCITIERLHTPNPENGEAEDTPLAVTVLAVTPQGTQQIVFGPNENGGCWRQTNPFAYCIHTQSPTGRMPQTAANSVVPIVPIWTQTSKGFGSPMLGIIGVKQADTASQALPAYVYQQKHFYSICTPNYMVSPLNPTTVYAAVLVE